MKNKNVVKKFKQFISENFQLNNTPEIEITAIDNDERSFRKKNIDTKYHVNYQILIDDKLLEIEGVLEPYNTGRNVEYRFEPSLFTDDETEEYYDSNWENIESEILNKLASI